MAPNVTNEVSWGTGNGVDGILCVTSPPAVTGRKMAIFIRDVTCGIPDVVPSEKAEIAVDISRIAGPSAVVTITILISVFAEAVLV